MKTALEILNKVEPNGELLDTDQAIEAMELYAEMKVKNLQQALVSGRSELLIALQNIEKICDNQNPTHEEIWRIAYGAINSH